MLRKIDILLIPACAGVIPISTIGFVAPATYPRVCGGDPDAGAEYKSEYVLSPRVRG